MKLFVGIEAINYLEDKNRVRKKEQKVKIKII